MNHAVLIARLQTDKLQITFQSVFDVSWAILFISRTCNGIFLGVLCVPFYRTLAWGGGQIQQGVTERRETTSVQLGIIKSGRHFRLTDKGMDGPADNQPVH